MNRRPAPREHQAAASRQAARGDAAHWYRRAHREDGPALRVGCELLEHRGQEKRHAFPNPPPEAQRRERGNTEAYGRAQWFRVSAPDLVASRSRVL
jgi:hypothetical protein